MVNRNAKVIKGVSVKVILSMWINVCRSYLNIAWAIHWGVWVITGSTVLIFLIRKYRGSKTPRVTVRWQIYIQMLTTSFSAMVYFTPIGQWNLYGTMGSLSPEHRPHPRLNSDTSVFLHHLSSFHKTASNFVHTFCWVDWTTLRHFFACKYLYWERRKIGSCHTCPIAMSCSNGHTSSVDRSQLSQHGHSSSCNSDPIASP